MLTLSLALHKYISLPISSSYQYIQSTAHLRPSDQLKRLSEAFAIHQYSSNMSSPTRLLRPALVLARAPQPLTSSRKIPRRTFVGDPRPLTLHASRTLPYTAESLYSIISDIPSYPTFIPFCKSASVLTESSPDANGKKWPATATLQIGYNQLSESFTSRVYCAPGSSVEAVSGDARTSLSVADLKHYENMGKTGDEETSNALFKSLRSRWSLRGYPYKPGPSPHDDGPHPAEASLEPSGNPAQGKGDQPGLHGKSQQGTGGGVPSLARTDVDLMIEIMWTNPVYAAMSQAIAPKIAGKIIEAFERRAKEVLGEGSHEVGGRTHTSSASDKTRPTL